MQTLEIRRLELKDLTPFRELRLTALRNHARVYLHNYEEEQKLPNYHNYLITNNFVMGAFLDDVLVGYTIMTGNAQPKLAHKATVWGAYVMPEHRSMDLATKLRERLFELAKKLGIKAIASSIVASNPAAIALHRSVGYVEMYREKDGMRQADGSYDEVIHLVKHL